MAKAPVIEKSRQEEPNEEMGAPTCQHHWVIETPRGALSQGRCKRCGEEREFRNSANDHVWEDDSGSSYNPWRGVRSHTSRGSDEDEMAASSRSSGSNAVSV